MSISKIDEKAQRTIAYIRVSSQRQVDEGVSIDAQEDRIREYAKFKGLDLDDATASVGWQNDDWRATGDERRTTDDENDSIHSEFLHKIFENHEHSASLLPTREPPSQTES